MKFSPKRDAQLEKLKADLVPDSPGFRVLCPTRWTIRAASLRSVIDNCTVLQELWWELSKDDSSDPTIKARNIGVQAQFIWFYIGVQLGSVLLQHSDNLSRALQSPKLSASEGQHMAKMTVATFQSKRDDRSFNLFWEKVELKHQSLDVLSP